MIVVVVAEPQTGIAKLFSGLVHFTSRLEPLWGRFEIEPGNHDIFSPERAGGVIVGSVEELLAKLTDEAKVL